MKEWILIVVPYITHCCSLHYALHSAKVSVSRGSCEIQASGTQDDFQVLETLYQWGRCWVNCFGFLKGSLRVRVPNDLVLGILVSVKM